MATPSILSSIPAVTVVMMLTSSAVISPVEGETPDGLVTAEYIKSLQITWSDKAVNLQAKIGSPVFLGNFTSNKPLYDATIKVSEELSKVIAGNFDIKNAEAEKPQHPHLYFYLPPGTKSGWYNGTVSITVANFKIPDALELSVFVPEVVEESHLGGDGTLITYMAIRSYSPYFVNTWDVAIWRTLPNGTSMLVHVAYDAQQTTIDGEQPVTLQTDRQIYGPDDDVVVISGTITKDILIQNETVYLAVFAETEPHHEGHYFVEIKPDGTFEHTIPIKGTLSHDGLFGASVIYKGLSAKTNFTILEGTVGNFVNVVQYLPHLEYVNGTRIKESVDTTVPVGQQLIISMKVRNLQHQAISFVKIVEIRNENGETMELFAKPAFNRSYDTEFEIEWMPKTTGRYTIHTFVVTDLDNPEPLTPVKITKVNAT